MSQERSILDRIFVFIGLVAVAAGLVAGIVYCIKYASDKVYASGYRAAEHEARVKAEDLQAEAERTKAEADMTEIKEDADAEQVHRAFFTLITELTDPAHQEAVKTIFPWGVFAHTSSGVCVEVEVVGKVSRRALCFDYVRNTNTGAVENIVPSNRIQ